MKLYEQYLQGQSIQYQYYVTAAAGVVVREMPDGQQSMLVIQRSKKDHWPLFFEFPRGKCDKPIGEKLQPCVKREIREETGLKVEVIKLIDSIQYIADEGKRFTTCYNFLCKVIDPEQEVSLSKEHQDFRWITAPGEANLILLPDQRKTALKVFETEMQLTTNPTWNKKDGGTVLENYLDKLQNDEKI
jgi:8-oxo-dGTP pyrophosphatase MutT (NUDIX family)